MKRRIAIVLLLLFLGAIVNVAVAWGITLCVWLVPDYDSPKPKFEDLNVELPYRTNVMVSVYQSRGMGLRQLRADWKFFGDLVLPGQGNLLVRTTAGWPAKAIEGECHNSDQMRWAIRTPREWHRPRALFRTASSEFLPLRPLWPGFIINTLFYAFLLWLLFAAPFATRRMLRRRRGQCEKCAYPVGVSRVCTECGAAVVRKGPA